MGEAEVGEDFRDGVAAVEGVEVDAVDAPIQEFPHLVGGNLDAEFARCILVVGEFFQLRVNLPRDGGAAEGGEPADLLECSGWGECRRGWGRRYPLFSPCP